MSKKRILFGTLLFVLAEVILCYLFYPAINIFAPSFYLCILVPLIIFLFATFGFKKVITIPVIIITMLTLIISLTHQSFTDGSSQVHSNIAKVSNNGTFAENTMQIKSSFDFPLIDADSAKIISENLLKQSDKYSESFTPSTKTNLIFHKDSYYFISTIEYVNQVDFKGIHGYTLVNIHTGEARIVELDTPIEYTPSATFNKNLQRYLRMNYPFYIFGSEHFEIDEEGNPYYIVPVLSVRSLTYGGKYIKKVLVVDAVNGEIQEYALSNVPEWIENIYSVERVMTEAKWYLKFNSSDLSWLSLTSGNTLTTRYHNNNEYYLFGKDSDIHIYTGVTLYSAPHNNIAFLVCNLRNGEIQYCYDYGIGEDSIQAAAQHLFLENQYVPSRVLLVNIEGEPVYYLTLKNHLNNVEAYALANQNSTTSFFISGKTLDEMLRSYYKLIGKPYPTIELDESQSSD